MNNSLKWSVLGFCVLLIIISWSIGCKTETKCEKLQPVPFDKEYIVYFKGPNVYNPQNPDVHDVLAALEDKFGDQVIDTCMCGIYRMQADEFVNLVERRHEASSAVKSTGDPEVFIDWNFPVNFGPIPANPSMEDTLTPVYSKEFHSDTIVSVAIVDTGFKPEAGDGEKSLSEYAWINPDPSVDDNCVDNDLNGFDVHSDSGISAEPGVIINDPHGTAVAGMVAGLPGDKYPSDIQLDLMNIKFTYHEEGEELATLFDAICGLEYAVKMEADVIVASWGLYQDTINHSLKGVLLSAGEDSVIVVAAAGNDTIDIDDCPFYPARFASIPGFEHVISVAAYNEEMNTLAEFSNYGYNSVLLAAPGKDVSVILPEGIGEMDGTSIAAPYIARAVSIIKAYNPDIGYLELRECLYEYINNPDLPIQKGFLKIPDNSELSECKK